MIRRTISTRVATSRSRRLYPTAERLEGRQLLYATLGGKWVYGARITYSFAPDGTSVGGTPSAWFQTMANRGISEQAWKQEFREAAATWQLYTGINFVEVSDNGAAFSVSGNQQNDSRFGDIRIAGVNLGGGVLGAAFLPPPFNGGTLAGDIVMNTAATWNVNSTYDIRTVAVHEIGHALGLDHSTIQSAVMFAGYTGTKQSLHSDDIAGIQSIYGVRPQDAFDAAASNQTSSSATNISGYINSSKQARLGYLDVTTSGDVDWYYVAAPAGTHSVLSVSVQSTFLSSLSPSVQLYNNRLQLVSSAAAANSFGATVTAAVGGVSQGNGYYIRVQAANGGPSSNGFYGLLVNFSNQGIAMIPPPNTTVLEQPNQGGGVVYAPYDPSLYSTFEFVGLPGDSGEENPDLSGKSKSGSWDSGRSGDSGPFVAHEFLSIGDLTAYGSLLTVDAAGIVESPGPVPPGPTSFAPWMSPQDGWTPVLLTGELNSDNLPRLHGRERSTLRALDRVIETWHGA